MTRETEQETKWETVGSIVGDKLEDKVGGKVEDTVGNKVDTVGDKLGDKLATWETRFQGSQNLAHTWAYIGERGRNRDTTPACDRKKEGGD